MQILPLDLFVNIIIVVGFVLLCYFISKKYGRRKNADVYMKYFYYLFGFLFVLAKTNGILVACFFLCATYFNDQALQDRTDVEVPSVIISLIIYLYIGKRILVYAPKQTGEPNLK